MEEMITTLKFDPCENPLNVNTVCSPVLLQTLVMSLLIAINAT